jgi:hypothetical protein
MPDFLALEWDHDQISGLHAHVSGGRVRVRRAFVLPRPSVAVAGSGPLPIAWLQTQLAERGISGGDVLVSLPRDEVVVKRIDLPETSDDELPVIVRFQAAAKSSVPLDELSLDFIPLPKRSEIPGREVLMATVPQQTLNEIRLLCENAGLKLQKVGLTPADVAELVARSEPPASDDLAGASLVVSQHGHRLEISVLRRSHLLFSHSARLSSEGAAHDPQSMIPEVSRSLVALRGAIPDVKIERAWTLLDPNSHGQMAEVLRKRLSCEVGPIDPMATVDWDRPIDPGVDPTLFSGPIGLLLAKADPKVPALDFLAPRQPPVKRDLRKRKLVMMGSGVAVLVALLAGNVWLQVRSLDSEIEELQNTKAMLAGELKSGEPVMKSAALIEQWENSGIPWLDQLANLTARMPSTERVYLKKLEFTPRLNAVLPKMKFEALARERADVLDLSEKLVAADERYRVLVPNHKSSTEDQYYAWQLTGEITLSDPPKPKGKGAKAAPAKPAEAAAGKDKPAEKPAEKPADEDSKKAPEKAEKSDKATASRSVPVSAEKGATP